MTVIEGIALILSLVSAFVIQEASSFSCDPKLDCQQGELGAFVPDPEDCHLYYICVKNVTSGEPVPSSVSVSCPTGQYFNQTAGECTAEITPCSNECYNFCNLYCTYELEFVAYPGNCSKYYLCLPGTEKIIGDCPANNPYFNGSDCTNDPYQCCDSCIPYCTTLYVEIADPFDCQSFYVCLQLGVPSEDYHEKCPFGQYFDSSINSCSDGTSCTSLCKEGDVQTTYSTSAPVPTSTVSATNFTETDVVTIATLTTTSSPSEPTDILTTKIVVTNASSTSIISSTDSVTSTSTTVRTTRCHHEDCDPDKL